MVPLPPMVPLVRRCQALAALDLILSPEWEYRYYSFNPHWSNREIMASMRNGSGDEWWIVFHRNGWAALKGLDHESRAWDKHGEKLSRALQQAIPDELTGFSTEPAFRWDQTSFAYFRRPGAAQWTRANDLAGYTADDAGDTELLALLVGSPADYVTFARDYYETEWDERLVAGIFELQPITAAIVKALNPGTSLQDIEEELFSEIQYPKA
jgi:hypothetical protein